MARILHRRTRMLKRCIAFALLAVVVPACGGGEDRTLSPPVKVLVSNAPHDVDKLVDAEVDIKVTGAENLTLKRRMVMHFVEIFGPTVPKATHFFSMSVGENVEIDTGYLRFTADLAPGSYEGAPGTYTISDKGVPPIAGKPNAIGGAAYVWFLHRLPKPLVKFDVMKKACTLRIESKGLDGAVHCPELATFDGKKSVEVHWTWKLV